MFHLADAFPSIFPYRKRKEKYYRDITRIHSASSELFSTLEIERLLPRIMSVFKELSELERGSVMIYDEYSTKLVIKESVGLSESARREIKFKPGEGIAGEVFSTGKPKIVHNTKLDSQYLEFFTGRPRPEERMLCLPLKYKSKVFGVVNLHSRLTHKPFTEYDLKLFEILANQCALAIASSEFYRLAVSDSLTGIYISGYFKQRLEYEIEISQKYELPLGLVLFDIDFFKKFNDTYGHLAGDFILKNLARLVKREVRDTDIVARYGGEEFAVIFSNTTLSATREIAERIREKIEKEKFIFEKNELSVTVSIGVSGIEPPKRTRKKPCEFFTGDVLISWADKALYKAKQSGRNRVEFFSTR